MVENQHPLHGLLRADLQGRHFNCVLEGSVMSPRWTKIRCLSPQTTVEHRPRGNSDDDGNRRCARVEFFFKHFHGLTELIVRLPIKFVGVEVWATPSKSAQSYTHLFKIEHGRNG